MTDRELLEAAAKAAGIEYEGVMLGSTLSGGVILTDRGEYWNPLTDDGDALRLAVKLGLAVDCLVPEFGEEDGHTKFSMVLYGPRTQGKLTDRVNEGHCTDPDAATRRAIVRAAAAMAKWQDVAQASSCVPMDNYYEEHPEAECDYRPSAGE